MLQSELSFVRNQLEESKIQQQELTDGIEEKVIQFYLGYAHIFSCLSVLIVAMISPAKIISLLSFLMQSYKWFEKLPYWLHAVSTGRYPSNLGCATRVYLGPCVV